MFTKPLLASVLYDPWLALVELVIGEGSETAYLAEDYFRVTFARVVDFRALRRSRMADREKYWTPEEPFAQENINVFEDVPAPNEVVRLDQGGMGIAKHSLRRFRQPWQLLTEGKPNLVTIVTWDLSAEFLYLGGMSANRLEPAEVQAIWDGQRDRYVRWSSRH
jgi:hypothetical protein